MTQFAQYMLPIIAFLVAIREGVIVWAIKLSMGIGCLAGMAAIFICKDIVFGFETLLSVFVGCYLVIYLATILGMRSREKRKKGNKNL